MAVPAVGTGVHHALPGSGSQLRGLYPAGQEPRSASPRNRDDGMKTTFGLGGCLREPRAVAAGALEALYSALGLRHWSRM